MKQIVFLLFIFLSLPVVAIEKSKDSEIKGLMTSYLEALHKRDLKKLQKMTSPKYFEFLNKNFLIKKIQQDRKFRPNGFDIKIKKANIKKDQFFINIKDKASKEYTDFWYVLKLKEKKLIISNMVHKEN